MLRLPLHDVSLPQCAISHIPSSARTETGGNRSRRCDSEKRMLKKLYYGGGKTWSRRGLGGYGCARAWSWRPLCKAWSLCSWCGGENMVSRV
ncbi:hypothetical protein HA466_0140920 [Hirschfeldia incana]|nr:hypothetical protein HA466_0140920 [Hirschfeldia incana]